MKVSSAHPKLHIYVDNAGSQQAAVRVGTIDIAVPSRSKASRVLYLGACDEARTVTTPARSGRLEGSDPAAYLIDTIGQSCYRAVQPFYTPGGSRPAGGPAAGPEHRASPPDGLGRSLPRARAQDPLEGGDHA